MTGVGHAIARNVIVLGIRRDVDFAYSGQFHRRVFANGERRGLVVPVIVSAAFCKLAAHGTDAVAFNVGDDVSHGVAVHRIAVVTGEKTRCHLVCRCAIGRHIAQGIAIHHQAAIADAADGANLNPARAIGCRNVNIGARVHDYGTTILVAGNTAHALGTRRVAHAN